MADYVRIAGQQDSFFGAAADTKPTVCPKGTFAWEYDTGLVYRTWNGGTNWVVWGINAPIKTIQTELKAITAVAADVQSVSSELSLLSLTGLRRATIFIDHAKDNASASVGQGTEYVVQVSQKLTGNDTWRSLLPLTAAITVPIASVCSAVEPVGETVIACASVLPAVGDIMFFKNTTIGNSEWANVIAVSAGVNFTLESGLTNASEIKTYYSQGEHFVISVDIEAQVRLRVVCNNTKGTTNKAIVWRCACITAS